MVTHKRFSLCLSVWWDLCWKAKAFHWDIFWRLFSFSLPLNLLKCKPHFWALFCHVRTQVFIDKNYKLIMARLQDLILYMKCAQLNHGWKLWDHVQIQVLRDYSSFLGFERILKKLCCSGSLKLNMKLLSFVFKTNGSFLLLFPNSTWWLCAMLLSRMTCSA